MQKGNLRILFIGILIVVALAVAFIRRDQFVELIQTMRGGSLLPLVLAVLLQFGKYISQAFAYVAAFKTVGDNVFRARDTLPLVFGSYFINVVAPSFNTAGVMLVIDSARRRSVPAGRATSAVLLMQISVITGFIVIMIVGFFVLQIAQHLSVIYFILGMVVVFFVGMMVAIMYVGSKNPSTLLSLLKPIARFANRASKRFRKGKELDPWVDNVVDSFADAGGKIRDNPKQAAQVFALSVLASTFELGCFCCVGLSFGLNAIPILIGGYVVATLFSWVAITPQGVGVAEAMIVVALTASGINATVATTIALVYRGVVFWMPFAIGSIFIHRTQSFKKQQDAEVLDGAQEVAAIDRQDTAQDSGELDRATKD